MEIEKVLFFAVLVGSILTGVIISRGAGFVHDLFEMVYFKSWQAAHEKEVARKTSANM